MSEASSIARYCKIAESYAKEIGLAEFEIERIAHARTPEKDEWVFYLTFLECDPRVENDGIGAIVVVDVPTSAPRLIESL